MYVVPIELTTVDQMFEDALLSTGLSLSLTVTLMMMLVGAEESLEGS